MGFCDKVGTKNQAAGRICRGLREQFGKKPWEMDGPSPYADYRGETPILRKRGVGEGDGTGTPQEIYQTSFELAKDEFIKGPDSPVIRLVRQEGVLFPMFFDDGDSATDADAILRAKIEGKIGEIRATLEAEQLVPNSSSYNQRLASELFQFIRKAEDQGGLGIQFDPSERPEVEPIEFYRGDRITACSGFSALYYGAALLAGLNVSFFEETSDGELYHSLVGIRYDPSDLTKIVFADPKNDDLVASEKRQNKAVFSEISPLDFLSGFHINRAQNNFQQEANPLKRFELEYNELEIALRYAPKNPGVHYTLAVWLLNGPVIDKAQRKKAYRHLQKAIELFPQFPKRRAIEDFLRSFVTESRGVDRT